MAETSQHRRPEEILVLVAVRGEGWSFEEVHIEYETGGVCDAVGNERDDALFAFARRVVLKRSDKRGWLEDDENAWSSSAFLPKVPASATLRLVGRRNRAKDVGPGLRRIRRWIVANREVEGATALIALIDQEIAAATTASEAAGTTRVG